MSKNDELYASLEKDGAAKIRRKLAEGRYLAGKIPKIEAWLEQKDRDQSERSNLDNSQTQRSAKNAAWAAAIAAIIAIIVMILIAVLEE